MSELLGLSGIDAGYGGVAVVRDASLEVAQGEAVAIIGPNGAGKTTLLKAIAGFVRALRGEIHFAGRRLDTVRRHDRVRAGVVYVPAERDLFPQMTVMENLELGAYTHFKTRAQRLEFVLQLFPRLQERRKQMAGTLSGGEQQMLAVGRGLMANPRILLLDEPSTGLSPFFVSEMYRQLDCLKQEGLTILLAEQQVPHALGFSDRAYVLENGHVCKSGRSADLLGDPIIQECYLGVA